MDRDLTNFPAQRFDLVGIDNLAGGHMIAEHLIKLRLPEGFYLSAARFLPGR